ncbi:MAG: hypothetical protein AABX13_04625 [Nanoarchaeota archaeon]
MIRNWGYECGYEHCDRSAVYCLEWWGVNQYGKNPIIVSERYSCLDPEHLIDLAHHNEYGGYPDEINSVETGEAKSRLLELVKKGMDRELDLDTLDNLVLIADPPPEQLRFSF